MGYSGAGGKLIHEKNQKQQILWHCLFKGHLSCSGIEEKGHSAWPHHLEDVPLVWLRAGYPLFTLLLYDRW